MSELAPEQLAGVGDGERDAGMPLLGHLAELRRRLMWSALALLLTTVASFIFADRILNFLVAPYGGLLQTLRPTEGLETFFKVSLVTGAILAMPVILVQVWLFVAPGLVKQERRYIYIFVPAATVLFLSGVAFAWFVLMPAAIFFLSNFMNDVFTTEWTSQEYIGFVTTFLFWMGVSFQMPVVIYFLSRTGLVTAKVLREQWRVAIVVIAVVAAAVTPTVDPLTMSLTMLPLMVLYILSLGLAAIGQRQFERSMAIE